MKKKFLKEKMDLLLFQRELLHEYSRRLEQGSAKKGFRKRMKEELGQYEKELKR